MRKIMIFSWLIGFFVIFGGLVQVYAAETVTVTGEVIDTYCYALMGAKGESHRECAIDCVKKSIPAGLLEDKTNKVYILLPDKDRSPLPNAVIDKLGRKATISGKVYTIDGNKFLTAESVK